MYAQIILSLIFLFVTYGPSSDKSTCINECKKDIKTNSTEMCQKDNGAAYRFVTSGPASACKTSKVTCGEIKVATNESKQCNSTSSIGYISSMKGTPCKSQDMTNVPCSKKITTCQDEKECVGKIALKSNGIQPVALK